MVSELVSEYVQECLTLRSKETKLQAQKNIQDSLRKCFVADDEDSGENDAMSLRQQWKDFLDVQGDYNTNDGESADTAGGDTTRNFMLRESLTKCLLENCRRPDDTNDSATDSIELMTSSFLCLTDLVLLRCNEPGTAKGRPSTASSTVFGHDFVLEVAPHVIAALNITSCDESDASIVSNSAMRLLLALLRADRPRNEICVSTIRDSILIPASLSNASPRSIACVAEVLSSSIFAAVAHAVPNADADEDEETAMRKETVVLTKLQDMRDVLSNVSLFCVEHADTGDDVNLRLCIVALQNMYNIAQFAVESQLESLLGDKASVLLSLLSENDEIDENEAETNDICSHHGDGASDHGAMEVEDLAPLYASLTKPPAHLTSLKSLEAMLDDIAVSLNEMDPERWDERLGALIDIECILAGGVTSMGTDARSLFIEKLKKMPIPEQFVDLRSQITHQACRVIIAMSYEFRDFVQEEHNLCLAMNYFVENCVPSILKLCMSGTRLMATQGMNCLLCLAAVCGKMGYPRLIANFCDDIVAKKTHKNRKRGAVLCLTSALRVWDPSCFAKHIDKIMSATKEAATDRDPGVREDGRKLYWACCGCDKLSKSAENIFDANGREMKQLLKVRADIDSEWESGAMEMLVRTGVLNQSSAENSKKRDSSKSGLQPPRVPRTTFKRPSSEIPKPELSTPLATRPSSAGSVPSRLSASRLPMSSGQASSSRKRSTPTLRRNLSAIPSFNCADTPSSVVKAQSEVKDTAVCHVQSVAPTPDITSNEKFTIDSATEKISQSPMPKRLRPPSSPSLRGKELPQTNATREMSPMPLDLISSSINDENQENMSEIPATPTGFLRKPSGKGSIGVTFNMNHASPVLGTPVVNLLARPSPISVEKVKNPSNVLGEIIETLSTKSSPHDRFLSIQTLALFAKDHPSHHSWNEKFPMLVSCLLDNVRQSANSNSTDEVIEFARSPTKNLKSHHKSCHLFLQGVRSLLQFVPGYISDDEIADITVCLLECTENAPFEIVHTAERALNHLVTGSNPAVCFKCLIPFITKVHVDLNTKNNPPITLSAIRTMRYLIEKVPIELLREHLSSLLNFFQANLVHKSIDMRKAIVFVIVEMYFVLGDELVLTNFSDCQQKLIGVYIEKHDKQTDLNPVESLQPQQMEVQ